MENPRPSAQDFFLPCTSNHAFNFTEIWNCAAILKEAVNLNGAVLQQHSEALALHGGTIPPPAAGDSHPRWWSEQRLTLPAGYPVQDTPPDVKHGGMVINMEEGDLATFLPQYEEDSVHEFNYFGKIIPPQHLGYLCEQEQSSRRSIPVHNRA